MISSCKVIRTILLATGVMLYACPALAGAWTQGAGRSYFKLNEEIVRANRYYEPTGNRVNIPTKGAWTTSLYVEYGLTRRVTVFGYFPFVKHITVNRQIGATSGFVFFPGDKKTGIGDIDAGVRIGLRTGGPVVVSLQISIGLPTGDSRQRNGLFTGDGEFNQQIMLQAGRSLHPFYISMEAGLNHRTGVYSEEFRYGFELGCAVHPRLTVAGRLGGSKPCATAMSRSWERRGG